jgi:hypothetical protein
MRTEWAAARFNPRSVAIWRFSSDKVTLRHGFSECFGFLASIILSELHICIHLSIKDSTYFWLTLSLNKEPNKLKQNKKGKEKRSWHRITFVNFTCPNNLLQRSNNALIDSSAVKSTRVIQPDSLRYFQNTALLHCTRLDSRNVTEDTNMWEKQSALPEKRLGVAYSIQIV